MTFSLTPRQRTLLMFLSASGYIAWFSGLGERTEAEVLGVRAQPIVTIDAGAPLPRVASVIRRDPFAGKPSPRIDRVDRAAPSTIAGDTNNAGTQVALAATAANDGVVVPDIDSRSAAAAPRALLLRATIVGPEPVAYVANGTAMDIVRVGDTLGERRVTKIDLRGISFSDGTRLDLPDAYVPTPRPERRRGSGGERITLQALRQLLNSARKETPPPALAAPAPQIAPLATYPSPGPLPTVDTQGLPVGVNPTANPNAPTPYPYPYPYAPPPRH